MELPSKKSIGVGVTGASIVAAWTLLMPYIDKALEFHSAWVRLQARLEQAERRLDKLERRSNFLHGRETPEEAAAERGNEN